jgi:hypothetical protein
VKKPLAVFTIARNEGFFLPRWVEYYSKLDCDLYVLDHESDDGSTALGIRAFVTPITRATTDDVGWMLGQVQDFQKALCQSYSRVLFAEVDEFLVPDPDRYQGLKAYLERNPHSPITATGVDVCWHSSDPPLDCARPILSQRRWKRSGMYDKTLIWSEPATWEVGFHRPTGNLHRPPPDGDLLLVHLHYCDREIAWERLQSRMKGRKPEPGGWGIQNKFLKREDFDAHFGQEVEGAWDIDEKWRSIL